MNELHNQLQQLLGDTYRLERELTAGMSRVFVAEETAPGRKVVIVMPRQRAHLKSERLRQIGLEHRRGGGNVVATRRAT